MNQIRASAAAVWRISRVDNLARLLQSAALCLLAGGLTVAPVAAYPSRAVTVIVPFAAGGPTDTLARIITRHLVPPIGQQVVIENVGGSGGRTAAIRTMRASPDGYSPIMGRMETHGSAPTTSASNGVFAPRKTPPDLIDRLKAAPGQTLDHPEARQELTALAGEIPCGARRSQAALARLVQAGVARWTPHPEPAPPPDGRRARQ